MSVLLQDWVFIFSIIFFYHIPHSSHFTGHTEICCMCVIPSTKLQTLQRSGAMSYCLFSSMVISYVLEARYTFEINLIDLLTDKQTEAIVPVDQLSHERLSQFILKCKCWPSIWTTVAINTFHIQNLSFHKALDVPKPAFRLLSHHRVLILAKCSKHRVGYYITSGSIWDLLNKSCWEDALCH